MKIASKPLRSAMPGRFCFVLLVLDIFGFVVVFVFWTHGVSHNYVCYAFWASKNMSQCTCYLFLVEWQYFKFDFPIRFFRPFESRLLTLGFMQCHCGSFLYYILLILGVHVDQAASKKPGNGSWKTVGQLKMLEVLVHDHLQ